MATNQQLSRGDALQLYDTLLDQAGANPSVGTSYETIWDDGGDLLAAVDGAGGTVTVASSDTNDTAAGTGARTVTVVGIVAGAMAEETATLNGQTAVTLTKAFQAVLSVGVATAGSGGVNAGAISVGWGTVTTGAHASGKRMAWIVAGNGRSASAYVRVPSGLQAHVVGVEAIGSALGTVQLCVRTGGVLAVWAEGQVGVGTTWRPQFLIPPICPEGGDVFLRAKAATSTILVGARLAVALHPA